MKGLSKFFCCLILTSLLLQAISPIFFSVLSSSPETSFKRFEKTSLHPERHSVIAPLILKEKEETESDDNALLLEFIPLIDFSRQKVLLAERHAHKITHLLFDNRVDTRPPLYVLNSTYVI